MDYIYIYMYSGPKSLCQSLNRDPYHRQISLAFPVAPAISIPKQWNDDPKLGAPVESLSILEIFPIKMMNMGVSENVVYP